MDQTVGTMCNSTKEPGQGGDLVHAHKTVTTPLLKPGLHVNQFRLQFFFNNDHSQPLPCHP